MSGIGSHASPVRGATDVWLTPPHIIDALGPFDLDPCAAPEPRPWPTAARHITLPDDGLLHDWEGFVWCNPPYGPETWRWLRRLAAHPGGGIALIFARTETEGFVREVWGKADAILFLEGRLWFHHPDGSRASGNSGGPSCLVGYGMRAAVRLAGNALRGAYVNGWRG